MITTEKKHQYTYNTNGYRVKKTSPVSGTTYYVFNQQGQVIHEENNGDIEEYVYVNGKHFAKKTEAGTYFYVTDHLGSTVVVTDDTGAILWSDDYTPFGTTTGDTGYLKEKGKYTGKDMDEDTGLYYSNARWLDPNLGRFITEDPIKDGMN